MNSVDDATETFLKNTNIGNDPTLETRVPHCPVGLKVRHNVTLVIASSKVSRISVQLAMPMLLFK